MVPEPTATARPRTTWRLAAFLALAMVVLWLDQAAKYWVRSSLPLNGGWEILPGWVHLSHTQNHGAAWGMLSGQRVLLIAVTIIVSVVVTLLAREAASRSLLPLTGFGLILGGALGNLADRVLGGAVTDFIDLDTTIELINTFPVFNVADAALTVGVILVLLDTLITRRLLPVTEAGEPSQT